MSDNSAGSRTSYRLSWDLAANGTSGAEQITSMTDEKRIVINRNGTSGETWVSSQVELLHSDTLFRQRRLQHQLDAMKSLARAMTSTKSSETPPEADTSSSESKESTDRP